MIRKGKIRLLTSQMEVLDMIALGITHKEIAATKGIREESVWIQVARIRRCIGVPRGKNSLLFWLAENGWDVPCLQSQKRSAA